MSCIDHGKKGLPKLPYALQRYNKKLEYMHRVAYAKEHGLTMEELKGKHVCHTCDNPRCINPAHLFLSDNDGNMRDKALKGRAPSKLSDQQVLAIRNAVLGDGLTQAVLAKQYDVDQSHISRIRSGEHGTYAEERMGLSRSTLPS